jgi:serine/threonine protein kinase
MYSPLLGRPLDKTAKHHRVSIEAGFSPLPDYTLVRKLGNGTFGSVWQATGPGGTDVAIKFIDMSNASGDVEWRAMQLAKRLRHANILPVLGIWLLNEAGTITSAEKLSRPRNLLGGRQTSQSWLVVAMPLVDATLADRQLDCPGSKIPRAELMRYMMDVAKAIDALVGNPTNRASLQHCDIKPSNIGILGSSAQLIDFGLLQHVDSDADPSLGGSPAYMPPERIRHEAPRTTSDQYSLAITYYELRTGRLPFLDCSRPAIRKSHLMGALDWSGLPEAEITVLRKATSLDAESRFATTEAFVNALIEAQGMKANASPGQAELERATRPSQRETSNVAEATRQSCGAPELPHIPGEPAKANELGMEYYRRGDYSVAFAIFSHAAIADHPAAQNNLGACYLYGRGVAKREDLALLWFQRAATSGHAAALDNIARYHAIHG